VGEWLKAEPSLDDEAILERVVQAGEEAYAAKTSIVDPAAWHQFERNVMLQSLDTHWREHLAALDHLRQGIHLRGYAQKNPKQEYKREAFELFESLLDTVRADVTCASVSPKPASARPTGATSRCSLLDEGSARGRRVHAEPLLRRAGAGVPRASGGRRPSARW
jgi:preprotein translocase subunit SecA